jgi:hypothetical protein
MPDPLESDAKAAANTLELAYLVADRVQLHNILVSDLHATRSPTLDAITVEHCIQTNVSEVRFGKDVEANRLFVFPTFTLKNTHVLDEDPERRLAIKATFVIFYDVESFEGLSDEHFGAFAATTGVFNAWPYWRELVQSTCARMGLSKPVIIPVFRLGQAEYTNQVAVDPPSPQAGDDGPNVNTALP